METSPVKFAPLNKAKPWFFTKVVVATFDELSDNGTIGTETFPLNETSPATNNFPFNEASPPTEIV